MSEFPSSTGQPSEEPEEPQPHFLPLVIITCVFGAIFIFGPLFVRRGPNKGIIKSCLMLSAFCLWLFWCLIYLAQMNPIMGPRVRNTTVAWMAYKYGNPVKTHDLEGND